MQKNILQNISLAELKVRILTLMVLVLLTSFPVLAQTKDSIITVAAGKHYDKSPLHTFLFGPHYRKVWAEPVEVPYFYIDQFKGGVTPLKQGGSFQTKNLRLVDSGGREYVIRSIDKDPSVALPKGLQKSFVAKFMRDQTSVIHPYGAFIVPTLASAAGVYHTNPKLIYIADDPALGEYQAEFAHMLALVEERPQGNWKELDSFGNPEDVVSSEKAFTKLINSPTHQVKTRQYLQSRLFDMWLSDWSRREDQWRWGVFEKEDITTYAPIPRDRDHAFFKFNDGLLNKMLSIIKPNYQSFERSIVGKNVKGLINSSFQMDMYLLASLNKDEFVEAALDLQQKLSDAVIEQALQQWPANIRALSAQEFSSKLKSRRDDLPGVATAFYKRLNKNLLLPGTDGKDTFQLEFKKDGNLVVEHWGTKKDEKIMLHQRTYTPKETKSISFYGLGDKDAFILKGEGHNKFKLTLQGGEDTDILETDPTFRLSGRKILLLDEEDGNEYPKAKMIKKKKYSPAANEFSGKGWLLRHRLH